MNKGSSILIGVVIIVAVGFVAGFGVLNTIDKNMQQLVETPLREIDLTEVQDGTYTGEHSVFPVTVKVEVIVRDHRITGIELLQHTHGRGGDAERILSWVMEEQTLHVDVVSGATYSSMVILKAIEDALKS